MSGRAPEIRKWLVLTLLAAWTACNAAEESTSNWPRWRGPQDNGSTADGSYPVKWDVAKVLWKTPLPGKGCSTPIVWKRRIYLTAPDHGVDAVLAFDWSGKPLWTTTFGQENSGRHRNGSGSNASPATDGQTVFVYFKSGTLAALELNGKVRWQTNLVEGFGPETFYWDHGTSPVLTEKYVIMARMHHGESWLAAFEKGTGKLIWKVPRNYETPVEGDHSYATPLIIRERGNEALLVWGAERATLHDASDGKLLWSCDGFNPEAKPNWPAVASVVVAKEVAVVASARSDRGMPRLDGIGLADGKRLWKREDTGTYVPTPVVYNGLVYILRDRGEVECIEPTTGKTVWSGAFPKTSSNFYASPVVAGGKLYAMREDGQVFVADIKDKFELLAENSMDEHVIASPVPVLNRLLVRGEQHLFCVAEKE